MTQILPIREGKAHFGDLFLPDFVEFFVGDEKDIISVDQNGKVLWRGKRNLRIGTLTPDVNRLQLLYTALNSSVITNQIGHTEERERKNGTH